MNNQEEQLRELAKILDKTLEDAIYKERMGFALLVFRFGESGVGDYISNADREDMIKGLRELADRLEAGETIPVTLGEA